MEVKMYCFCKYQDSYLQNPYPVVSYNNIEVTLNPGDRKATYNFLFGREDEVTIVLKTIQICPWRWSVIDNTNNTILNITVPAGEEQSIDRYPIPATGIYTLILEKMGLPIQTCYVHGEVSSNIGELINAVHQP